MEPKRLLDGGGSEIELLLVSAGRAARPSRMARFRAGIALTLATLGLTARAASRPNERRWGAGRWVLVGVTTTALAWGTAHETRAFMERRAAAAHANETAAETAVDPPRAHATRAQAPSEAPVEVVPSRPPGEVSQQAPVPAGRRATGAARPGSSGARSIGREIEELDRARRAIASGESVRALEQLDAYGKAFPRGVLQQESLLLRAEALVASGDRARARQVAERALLLYPHSAHRQRFQSLADMP